MLHLRLCTSPIPARSTVFSMSRESAAITRIITRIELRPFVIMLARSLRLASSSSSSIIYHSLGIFFYPPPQPPAAVARACVRRRSSSRSRSRGLARRRHIIHHRQVTSNHARWTLFTLLLRCSLLRTASSSEVCLSSPLAVRRGSSERPVSTEQPAWTAEVHQVSLCENQQAEPDALSYPPHAPQHEH